MAVPALRQPKLNSNKKFKPVSDVANVIVTLKDGKSLFISSDAYHGIVRKSDRFQCVFCSTDMDLDVTYKEHHKKNSAHVENLRKYPHVDGYGSNLVRKLKDAWYCTTCGSTVPMAFLSQHINTLSHNEELEIAITKATAYKPSV